MTTLVGVCTTRAGQTSTHFAASLAWALAARGEVVLVDADMEGGTLCDLFQLDPGERSIANCFGDGTASSATVSAQAVVHPRRPTLRLVPGLPHSHGCEVGECLRQVGAALRGLRATAVVVDLGHPLAHPGLRSPRAAAEAICQLVARLLIVVRDDPALLARSVAVLSAARPAHGELILCRSRGGAYGREVRESLRRNLPTLPVRDLWSWDPRAAERVVATGIPTPLGSAAEQLNLVAA